MHGLTDPKAGDLPALPKASLSSPRGAGWFTAKQMQCYARLAIAQERARVAEQAKDAGRMEDALEQIAQWARAYPIDIFPEPDMAKAHAALQAVGMTLDAVSASNMRHVITQVQAIVDAAIAQGETK